MSRTTLMQEFLMTIRNPAQKPLARSTRQATYKICRKCGAMMLEDNKGGITCADNCNSNTGINFSGQHNLTDTNR